MLERILVERLKKWRCAALLGARQVGKSYLLKEVLKTHPGTLITFDDPLECAEAAKDPLRYLEQRYRPGEFCLIDEAARVPEIFRAVKILVDRYDPQPTGICLANSGNFLLLKRIHESLAGRVSLLSIYPLSWQEIGGWHSRPGLLDLFARRPPTIIASPASFVELARTRSDRMAWGGYPQPTLMTSSEDRIAWVRDYLKTYILPLVIEEFGIRDPGAFERAAALAFGQSAQFLNVAKIAQRAGMSQPTTNQYLHHLEAMMVIERVPIFVKSVLTRVVKMPKLYVVDPLLMHHAVGTHMVLPMLPADERIGTLYESFVLGEVKKTLSNVNCAAVVSSWRTPDKTEVDLIITGEQGPVPIEIKWSPKPSRRDASGLNAFLAAHRDVPYGYLVYPGETVQQIADKVFAIPDWWLLGCF
ncbi:MAG: ATP-binding protein [Deltaproteobacteria bacterium]|nr:ATP-binding protein [Deltaproteobacteria bacterium]